MFMAHYGKLEDHDETLSCHDKKEPRQRGAFLWEVILLKHLGVELILNVQDIFCAQL